MFPYVIGAGYKPGTTVAIKVRHPGVGAAILRDFGLMVWVAHLAALVPALAALQIEETLKQFAAPLREQAGTPGQQSWCLAGHAAAVERSPWLLGADILAPGVYQVDLAREAHNLWRFGHNFRKTRSVHFPAPLYPLVAPDVLVETYEPGVSISRYIADPGNPINRRLAALGSGTMLQVRR
jgi:aarF domain-containing kinase